MANPGSGSKEDLKRANRKLVKFGELTIKKAGKTDKMTAFINITEYARKQLGLTAVSAKQKKGDKEFIVFGAMANKCKVYMKPTGSGASRKQKTVTITVPAAASVDEIAKFLLTNAKGKAVAFAPKGRGRSLPLGLFEAGGPAAA